MDHYSILRELADSWVLIALFLFFIASVVWAFRPGSNDIHSDSAALPFRNDDRPASNRAEDRT